jgi:hypothetical protein
VGASLLAKNDDTVLRLLINPDSLKTFGKIPVIPNTKSNNQKQTLTLALSQRERGLTGVFGRGTPTWDTELNSSFEKPKNRLPLPRERAGVRGESNEDQKIAAFGSSYMK